MSSDKELIELLRDERHLMQGNGLASLLETCREAADRLEALSGGEAVGDYQLRPKTAALVRRFMSALASKLAAAEVKYGYSDAWIDPAWEDECRRQLHHHAAKGDPRDVAAYAAFCWHHGWSTTLPGSFSPITENDPSREESRTPRQSASSRVSHGLHMKVKGGKIVYRRKSRVVE